MAPTKHPRCDCERCDRARAYDRRRDRVRGPARRADPAWNERARRYYHDMNGVAYNRLLLRHRRIKALARMAERNED